MDSIKFRNVRYVVDVVVYGDECVEDVRMAIERGLEKEGYAGEAGVLEIGDEVEETI